LREFPTIDRVHELLDQIAEEIPQAFYKDLNGGIVLLESSKEHPIGRPNHPLYIMGEYHRSVIGRQIIIYYGSFQKAYRNMSEKKLYEKLKETLLHEFTHHLENMAGERGLEIKDARQLNDYRRIR